MCILGRATEEAHAAIEGLAAAYSIELASAAVAGAHGATLASEAGANGSAVGAVKVFHWSSGGADAFGHLTLRRVQ